jgi:hypothetical protein
MAARESPLPAERMPQTFDVEASGCPSLVSRNRRSVKKGMAIDPALRTLPTGVWNDRKTMNGAPAIISNVINALPKEFTRSS